MLGVRGMAIGAALTFGAILWWATRGTETAAEGTARLREAPASHAGTISANAWVAAAVKDEPAAALPPDELPVDESQLASEEGFRQYVWGKYHFLLEAHERSPRGSVPLRAALLERESLVVRINTARQGSDHAAKVSLPEAESQLAALDQRISQALPASDLAAFAILKDSHIEQFQLDDFAQGIGNVAPLDDGQRRAILYSKLAYRHRFREVLDQSGLLGGALSPSQRQAVLGDVARALRESRDSFLQEARQHLGDELQFSLLANYENTEYAAEMEKLHAMAAAGS